MSQPTAPSHRRFSGRDFTEQELETIRAWISDNDTLRRILDDPEAMAAMERIEGWRALGNNIIETIINKSELVKKLKDKAKDLSAKKKKSHWQDKHRQQPRERLEGEKFSSEE